MVDTMVGLMAEIFNLMEVINLPEALHHWAAQRKSPPDLASDLEPSQLADVKIHWDLDQPWMFHGKSWTFFGAPVYDSVQLV